MLEGTLISDSAESQDIGRGPLADDPVSKSVYRRGIFCVAIQLVISIVPWVCDGRLATCLFTVCGILLAFVTGALLRQVAMLCGHPPRTKNTVFLTADKNPRHALVVLEQPFSTVDRFVNRDPEMTCLMKRLLAVLWLAHYLFASKADPLSLTLIAMAGSRYNSDVAELHLKFEKCIAEPEVADTLNQLVTEYPDAFAAVQDELKRR